MKTAFGTATALAAMSAATAPAMAATFDLGTLQDHKRVFAVNALAPGSTDTYTFNVNLVGDLGSKILNLGGLSGLTASFYSGAVGSGTLLKTIGAGGSGNLIGTVTPGSYYAVVGANGGAPGSYNLSLIAEANPVPAPGPAGLVVFGAGAAALFMRKRREKAAAGH